MDFECKYPGSKLTLHHGTRQNRVGEKGEGRGMEENVLNIYHCKHCFINYTDSTWSS